MKKILITGCFGFIGSHWTSTLLKNKNYKITGIDIKDKPKNFVKNKNFTFKKISIFENEKLENLIKKNDFIFHFAAIPTPDTYINDPIKILDITAFQAVHIVKLCVKYNKIIYFTSTSEIYGKNPDVPYRENSSRVLGSTDIDRWCYSTSKALVEHYIKAYSKHNGLKYIIFRLFNIYGPNLNGRVLDKFIDKALSNKTLTINGKGTQTRCFLEVDDCMNAFYKIFSNKKLLNNTFNIGTNKQTTIINLAKKIIKLTNSKSKIKFKSYKKLSKLGYEDMFLRVPDPSYLISKTKWKPKVSLDDGLKRMILSIKNNNKK